MVSAIKAFKERHSSDCAPYFSGKAQVTGSDTLEDSAYSASIDFFAPEAHETESHAMFSFNASYIQRTEEDEGHYATSVIFNDFTTNQESVERKERYVEALTSLISDGQDIKEHSFDTTGMRVSCADIEPITVVAALEKAELLTTLQYDKAESLATDLQDIAQQERTACPQIDYSDSDQNNTSHVFA